MKAIETARTMFRLYCAADRSDFVALMTDPEVMKYVDKGVLPLEKAEALWEKLVALSYPSGVDTIWGVFAKDDGRYIGNASIRPRPEKKEEWEIGYILRSEEWGKGLASEIAVALADFGFERLGLEAVYATVDVDNMASRRVLDKTGMALFSQEYDEEGVFYLYRVTRDEFYAVHSSFGHVFC